MRAKHQAKRIDFLLGRLYAMFEEQMNAETKLVEDFCQDHFRDLKQQNLADMQEKGKEREKAHRKECEAQIKHTVKDAKNSKHPLSEEEVYHLQLEMEASLRRMAMDDVARFDYEHAQIRERLHMQLAQQADSIRQYYEEQKASLHQVKETLAHLSHA